MNGAKQRMDTFCKTLLEWGSPACIQTIGGLKGLEGIFQIIVQKYDFSRRYYHNFSGHILQCLEELDLFVKEHVEYGKMFLEDELRMAIIYHDIVYNVRSDLNESRSSKMMAKDMQVLGVNDATVYAVDVLINRTNHTNSHEVTSFDGDATTQAYNAIVDIDLSIFGKVYDAFKRYDDNIRLEYIHVSDEDFKKGRKEILQEFLNLSPLYLTPFFRDLYEEEAKVNLERILSERYK